MMTVTKIEPLSKTRYKVYLDGQFAFTLYKGELSRYHIAEESVIEDDIYDSLRLIVIKRAKLRAMHLLSDMGRTESQLRTKLKQGGYAEDAVEAAIRYVKSFGYINDMEYARSFIDSRKDRKSKKELYAALLQKGVPAEIVEQVFEETGQAGYFFPHPISPLDIPAYSGITRSLPLHKRFPVVQVR